jgi:hypothetical protein
VNCVAARDRLTEFALRTLPSRDSTALDRHLQWCAACRKEAGELDRAVATLAFSVAAADPDPQLEDRVVSSVQHAAGRGQAASHGAPRRGRLAVAAVVAAMVAISGLGWGAVMAGRAARSEVAAKDATRQTESSIEAFQRILRQLPFRDPSNEALVGRLAPAAGTAGGGSAITLVSPSLLDMAVVIVSGLPAPAKGALPYTVFLRDGSGHAIVVGQIKGFDASGGDQVARDDLRRDLSHYDTVTVANAKGKIVLSGSLTTRAGLASPSP